MIALLRLRNGGKHDDEDMTVGDAERAQKNELGLRPRIDRKDHPQDAL